MKLHNIYYLMRHGQTAYQAEKKHLLYPNFKGTPVFLSKKGIKQVEASANKLKKEKIDFIYASDFHRITQTAKIIAKKFKNLKINFDKRLRDTDFGFWHGKRKEDFFVGFPLLSRKLFYKRPKGGEKWPDCKKRMKSFFKEIEKKYKNKTILIVSHGDPLWLLEGYIKGYSVDYLADHKKKLFLKTGSFKKL